MWECQGADEGLEEAIADVMKVLKLTGVKVIVNKIHISNNQMTMKHKFVSSPTIRVNGRDILNQYQVMNIIKKSISYRKT